MSMIIAFIAIGLFGAVLLFYHPKPKGKMERKHTPTDDYNDCVMYCNKVFNRYRDSRNRVNEAAGKYDYHAYESISYLITDNDSYVEECNDYLERAYMCLSSDNPGGVRYCIENALMSAKELEIAAKKMDAVVIEDCRKTWQQNPPREDESASNTSVQEIDMQGYFSGCNTREELDARYKSLAKAFHPDVKAGNAELFRALQEEYETLKKNA